MFHSFSFTCNTNEQQCCVHVMETFVSIATGRSLEHVSPELKQLYIDFREEKNYNNNVMKL